MSETMQEVASGAVESMPEGMRRSRVAGGLAFGGLVAGAAVIGVRSSTPLSPWYLALRKPRYQPPARAFGPIWTTLYALIAGSGYRVWRSRRAPRGRALALWGAQLALNAAWPPLFFGARRPRAALVDAALLVPAIGGYAWAARKVDRTAAAMVLPYLAWSGFALMLNADIVRRNRRTLARR